MAPTLVGQNTDIIVRELKPALPAVPNYYALEEGSSRLVCLYINS